MGLLLPLLAVANPEWSLGWFRSIAVFEGHSVFVPVSEMLLLLLELLDLLLQLVPEEREVLLE